MTAENLQFRKKEIVSDLTGDSKQTSSTDNLLIGGLNNRIQEILQRLQNQKAEQTQNRNEQQLLNAPNIADLSSKEITESDQTLIQSEIRPEEIGHSISEHAQADNRQLDAPDMHASGLLQIPTWLTQLQTGLNHRWQEINTKAEPEPEPVVNVTIGRVEVRAVQTDSPKQPKSRNKPSGVMSLDDYLKQRENRGKYE